MTTPSSPNGAPANLAITTTWEKPFVASSGGEASLLVRIKAAARKPEAGSHRAPVDVAFVLDRSGSMTGEKLELVKEAVDVAVAHLADEDRAALVIYDHEVETLHHLEPATARVKTAIRLALRGIDSGGSTNLAGGWLTACGELSKDEAEGGRRKAENGEGVRIRRSLLLTDGLANVGMTDGGELAYHAGELRRRGVTTTTLGVGLDFDEDLLAGMAEAGGGNFQFIARPSELRAFFAKELGELLTVVAAGLTVSLTMPHGVRARLLNLFPVDRQGKRIDVAVRELLPGDDLCLIFALTTRPSTAGATHLLTLDATWSDPAADRRQSFSLTLPPLVVADPATVDQTPPDPEVAEEAALQRAHAEQREAMRLDRQGRHAESRALLRESAAALSAAPMTAQVQEHYDLAMHYAAFDASSAYDETTRKRATHDAHRASRGKREDK
ncbi:MAG: vWA domain-containing protein [Thermomicrobiales bacterium]